MSRRTWIIAISLAAIIILAGAWLSRRPNSNDASPPIIIGAILPLTGEAAQWGIPPRDGAILAIEEINRRGGVNGRPLQLVTEDDRCNPRDGVSAINSLTARQSVSAIIGASCSGVTLAIAPIAERSQIALISPASTNPTITHAGDYIFRVVPSDDLRGQVFADYIFNGTSHRKVSILYINNEGGVGNRNSFRSRFLEMGGSVLLEEAYSQDSTDLRSQLTKISKSDTQAIIVVSYPRDTPLVLRQAHELGVTQPLFFQTEAVEDANVLREAGATAEGVVYILPAPAMGDASTKFRKAYQERYKKGPELYAAEGYDAVHLIASAFSTKNGSSETSLSGTTVRDHLLSLKNWTGASGSITFDPNGDVIKPMAIKKIENGQPKILILR